MVGLGDLRAFDYLTMSGYKIRATVNASLSISAYPARLQAVERAVQLVSEAADKVIR